MLTKMMPILPRGIATIPLPLVRTLEIQACDLSARWLSLPRELSGHASQLSFLSAQFAWSNSGFAPVNSTTRCERIK